MEQTGATITMGHSSDVGWLVAPWNDTLPSWHCLAASMRTHTNPPAMVNAKDQQDVTASLAGDGEAFSRLVARYQNDVGQWMWRFTRDHGQWEILVQDALVEAYTSLANYRGRGPFGAWLRTVSTRVGYKFWKQRDRRLETEPLALTEWDAAVESSAIDAADAADLVYRTLAQLKPRDRLVLTLLYLEGCSVAECAERTGWSRALVKVQAHRARGKLRQILDRETNP